ncbi:MAG: CCA tRNA nucleotidyltransferase [Hyphomicrobiaceae bacterium]|nr:CCA tRNA nucleotidyltransferase [Hyphomicrobiaceae bacterium]
MHDQLPAKPPSLRDADWLSRPETRELFAALNDGGHTARAVGGAVRNTLLGTPVHDVDIATTSSPDTTIALAAKAGLRAVPTGIEHGTVTVVVRHTPFEVTTLRTDVETFGRHARVAFTDDWAADARRRDFTINALYCDADGVILDPLDGYSDIVARRVRFIGEAEERIREDYLRILRFFRFSAEYAGGDIDGNGLQACQKLSHGLDQLSRERIRAELLRLVVTQHVPAVVPVIASDFLTRIFPDAPDVRLLERVAAIEDALGREPDPILRLGALSGAKPGSALPLRDALRLSAREFERLARLSMPDPAFNPANKDREAKAFIYRHGPRAFTDGVMLAWAHSRASVSDAGYAERLALPDRWQAPPLPVRGSDVIELGVAPGPRVGRIVAAFEDWWIGADFPEDAARLTSRLAQLAAATDTNDD